MLGFPGLFKGILEAGVSCFTDKMLIKAAEVIHEKAPEGQLVPDPLDQDVHGVVARAVKSLASCE